MPQAETSSRRRAANEIQKSVGLPQRADKSRLLGIVCALVVILLFSSITLSSRLGQAAAMPISDVAALRFGVAGLILLPIVLRYGLSGVAFGKALRLAFLGGLGFALLAYGGFFRAPAAHGAALLHCTLPLSTFLVVAVLDTGKMRKAALPGILLITLGIAIFAGESLREATAGQLLGDALLLLASFCWSAYAVMALSLNISPIQTAAIVAVFSTMYFVPPYLIVNGTAFLQHAWPVLVAQALIQGVLIGVVSIFAYTCAVRYLGASETSLFTAAVPTLTTLIAIPLLAEYPAPAEWIGVGVTTLGMILAMRGYYKPQSVPQKRPCSRARASET